MRLPSDSSLTVSHSFATSGKAMKRPRRARVFDRMRPLVLTCVLPVLQHLRKKNAPTQVFGLTLETAFEVYHPRFFPGGRMLAEYITRLPLQQRQFLDMGTGSGLVGLVAARRGANVTAVDIDPLAVQLATRNARLNGLASRFRALVSDLFAHLSREQRFDVIAFEPPVNALRVPAETSLLARFLNEAQSHLRPSGQVVLLLSHPTVFEELQALLQRFPFAPRVCRPRHTLFGSYWLLHLVFERSRIRTPIAILDRANG